ncbi:hypothetical protein GCM10010191_21890 [Actinomadura vinacea]|uniref:Secreted protein n=1 Tax=Actinomadura vinacea TaxID=115336 RepID=A0ABN3IT89_9ACTN
MLVTLLARAGTMYFLTRAIIHCICVAVEKAVRCAAMTVILWYALRLSGACWSRGPQQVQRAPRVVRQWGSPRCGSGSPRW